MFGVTASSLKLGRPFCSGQVLVFVGGQNPGGVPGTSANTKKQEFESHLGYEKEVSNMVIDQMTRTNHAVAVGFPRLPMVTMNRSQMSPTWDT